MDGGRRKYGRKGRRARKERKKKKNKSCEIKGIGDGGGGRRMRKDIKGRIEGRLKSKGKGGKMVEG